MATSPEVSMRNFSAILLKKNIIVIFDNLPSDLQREEVKKILLDSYFHETAKPVRESIAIVISYLVNANYMKDKGWPELFLLVDQKTNTNSPLLEREKGMALMSYLVELTTGELYQKYEKYLQFFITNIQDSERSVKILGLNFFKL